MDRTTANEPNRQDVDPGAVAAAESTVHQEITVAIDVLERERVQPFWLAALDYVRRDGAHLYDPRGDGPVLYFQQMDEPRPQRNRIHIDVWLDPDDMRSRIQTAINSGGVLVSDEFAPRWWILADAEGNEVCIAARRS